MESRIKCNLKNENIILSSRVRLSRNLDEIPFPNKLTIEKGKELVEHILTLFKNINEKNQFFSHKTWEEDEELIKLYIEKKYIDNDILKNKNKSGFILESNYEYELMINGVDHIKIQSSKKGLSLDEAFKKVSFIDDFIDSKVNYAFNKEFGYLTEKSINVGTAMEAFVLVHLPGITLKNEISSLTKELNKADIKICYLQGNTYEVCNNLSLSLSEKEIIDNLKATIRMIELKEKNIRLKLLDNNKFEIKDKIFRALGILQEAFIMDLKECLNLISLVRFGIELSLINNIEIRKIDDLLNQIKPLNIQIKLNKKLSSKEIDIERARILRESLNY